MTDKKQRNKIYTLDDSRLLMEVSGLLSYYFLKDVYSMCLNLDKASSVINQITEDFYKEYGDMENINLIGEEPYNYGFSGDCWRFQDAVKEYGKKKLNL